MFGNYVCCSYLIWRWTTRFGNAEKRVEVPPTFRVCLWVIPATWLSKHPLWRQNEAIKAVCWWGLERGSWETCFPGCCVICWSDFSLLSLSARKEFHLFFNFMVRFSCSAYITFSKSWFVSVSLNLFVVDLAVILATLLGRIFLYFISEAIKKSPRIGKVLLSPDGIIRKFRDFKGRRCDSLQACVLYTHRLGFRY